MSTFDETACPVETAARRWPSAVCWIQDGKSRTFEDLRAAVAIAGGSLARRRIGRGTRVGLLLENGWDQTVLTQALRRAGAIVCPLNRRLPPSALDAARRQAGLAFIVTDDASRDLLGDAKDAIPAAALVRGGSAEASMVGDDVAVHASPGTIIFSSGSKGVPKPVVHAWRAHLYSALGANRNMPLQPGDRWLLSLPLYHVGGQGIVWRCLLAGAAVVVPRRDEPLDEAVRAHRITHLSVVDTQLRRLLRAAAPLDSLKAVLVGGGPVAPGVIEDAQARWPVHMSYGLTEMASQVTCVPAGATAPQRVSAGRVLPHRDLRVSAAGEILVRGETLFMGLATPDGVTPAPLDAGGWYATGDLGQLDAGGWLCVRGRLDNMFISGGENIQPEEIERALIAECGAEEALVVPVADAEFGRRPYAFVRQAGAIDAAEALRRLSRVLPRYMLPVHLAPWPAGAAGALKPDRRRLEALAAAQWAAVAPRRE